MPVNDNFSPQTNKTNVVFVLMRSQILVVTSTPVTPNFSPDFIFIFFLFSFQHSPFISSTPSLFFHFFFSLLRSSIKLWIPTGPERTVMFPICLHLVETK